MPRWSQKAKLTYDQFGEHNSIRIFACCMLGWYQISPYEVNSKDYEEEFQEGNKNVNYVLFQEEMITNSLKLK